MSLAEVMKDVLGSVTTAPEVKSDGPVKPKTALMMACKRGNMELVKLIVEKGVDLNLKDKEDWTALMFACCEGNEDIVKFLIEKGADVNCVSDKGETALYFSYNTNKNIVKALIEAGADLNIRNNYGYTALSNAIDKKDYVMAELLIESGADVN